MLCTCKLKINVLFYLDIVYCGNLQQSDFDGLLPTTMTFTGSTSETFTVTITEDGIAEDTESFHIIIDSVQDNSGGQSLSIGTPKFAVLEVRDNDGGKVLRLTSIYIYLLS